MPILLAIVLLFPVIACAQYQPVESAAHQFWDKENIAIHAGNFALQTADAFTTRHVLDHHRGIEHNPWARQFVTRGWAGRQPIVGG